MRATLVITLLFSFHAAAQLPGPIVPNPPQVRFPTALRLYLDLNDTQIQAIIQANDDYQRLAAARYGRLSQVQREIAEETAKDPIDPMALGLRYVEIESIRRFLTGERTRLRERIRQVLTDPQRAKLKALEDALNLLPLYNEALSVNLLEQAGSPWFIRDPMPGSPGLIVPVISAAPPAAQQVP